MQDNACTAADHGCDPNSVAGQLKKTVADQIAGSQPTVLAKVTAKLVQDELDRRADLVLRGLTRRDELHRQLAGLTPDQSGLDAAGKVVCETYSKGRFEARQKVTETLAKLSAALETAIQKGEYCDLKEALGLCTH